MKSVFCDNHTIYPSKIVCVGRNYPDHIKELGNALPSQPVIFLKPNSAIANRVISDPQDEIHYEAEICFLIQADKLSAVGFGLDLTKRTLQTRLKTEGLPWERAKAFDNSAVFSEFVSFNGDVDTLRMVFYINDKRVQHGACEQMLNKPAALLTEAKTFLSFEDGDLLMTGTPQGVGPLKTGDRYTGQIFTQQKLIVEASWIVE